MLNVEKSNVRVWIDGQLITIATERLICMSSIVQPARLNADACPAMIPPPCKSNPGGARRGDHFRNSVRARHRNVRARGIHRRRRDQFRIVIAELADILRRAHRAHFRSIQSA